MIPAETLGKLSATIQWPQESRVAITTKRLQKLLSCLQPLTTTTTTTQYATNNAIISDSAPSLLLSPVSQLGVHVAVSQVYSGHRKVTGKSLKQYSPLHVAYSFHYVQSRHIHCSMSNLCWSLKTYFKYTSFACPAIMCKRDISHKTRVNIGTLSQQD